MTAVADETVPLPVAPERPPLKVLGVRHHGPGSAHAVVAALDWLRPEVVLIEGPPEAEKVVELAAHPEMEPPVALLAHVVGNPARAAFWPFASFSPEWQAISWALAHDVPVRFIDLPAANLFGFEQQRREEEEARRARASEDVDEDEEEDEKDVLEGRVHGCSARGRSRVESPYGPGDAPVRWLGHVHRGPSRPVTHRHALVLPRGPGVARRARDMIHPRVRV